MNGFAVSMPSAFFATLFQWLRRFNGFAVSVATPFEWLRRLNAFGVSEASAFDGLQRLRWAGFMRRNELRLYFLVSKFRFKIVNNIVFLQKN